MQDFWIALLIGFLIGWLLEWLIDWQYWRSTVRALRRENEQLWRQIAGEDVPDESPSQHASELATSTSVRPVDKEA